MTAQLTVNRRRVLELSGVGAGLTLAGCLDGNDADFEGDRGDLEDDERRVTMAVQLDQAQLEQAERELLQQIDEGELTQEEAQAEFNDLQEQLTDEAFSTVIDEFDAFDLTIEDRFDDQQALLLVAGPATDILDAIETDVIQFIGSGSLFEQIQQAQEQQPEGEPVEEPVE